MHALKYKWFGVNKKMNFSIKRQLLSSKHLNGLSAISLLPAYIQIKEVEIFYEFLEANEKIRQNRFIINSAGEWNCCEW